MQKSLAKLFKFEGIYSFDKDDNGGETYFGISRNSFPNWIGWKIIDSTKNAPHFLEILKANLDLERLVFDFYYSNFWTAMKCDVLPEFLSTELFELSVNVGTNKATKIVQTAVNLLNNNQKYYKDIQIDGSFGNVMLAALQNCLAHNPIKRLFNVINILQGTFYIELMQKNPTNEKFIGWFNRIEIINA